MTRVEARSKVIAAIKKDRRNNNLGHYVWSPDDTQSLDFVMATLDALGLIEFEPRKSEEELMFEALRAAWTASIGSNGTDGPAVVLRALTECGFTIARKP